MGSFKKLLIANRGEIAVRIIRACREVGLPVVAVYSDADRGARHVRMADEAYPIGGAAPKDSYLQMERILDVAKRSGADALHPGYGFLSENPDLAEACERAGITFVGPTAEAMRRIGEKTSARAVARAAGVPVVPGSPSRVGSLEELRELASQAGYPVLLKACSGGGGKGMRRVDSEAGLADAFRAAASEARSAFGDGCVYLEKLIEHPRHVEVQLLADTAGNVVCLGERDCSIQRRHQKLIEETPSPAVTPALRAALFDAATRVARSAGYLNAGTAEFLVDGRGGFYFLEMNARLQVEHPVTEEALGLDLVREQLRIAAGSRLDAERHPPPAPTRSAIECRIYAEDPRNGFLPSTGTIELLQQPAGPGVRVESASYSGMVVGPHYDPLLAKLVAWGGTREEVVARMGRALREYVVLGVKTTIPFHRFAMAEEGFLQGHYDTHFVERWFEAVPEEEELLPVAVAAAALLAARRRRPPLTLTSNPNGGTRWGAAARREAVGWR
ncbi:MAG: acetyl/propionyl/methylcrotonyl-CoA carboxylase subunit alpha [Sphingomonadaceae bacterium]